MRPTAPTLAIRFSIDALEAKHPGVSYGEAAWSIVDGAVDLSSIRGESSLFEGDSLDFAHEYVFYTVFQNASRSILDRIQTSMEASPEFREVADSQAMLTDQDRGKIVGLPLVHNADINDGEINILVSTLLRSALAKRKQAQSKPLVEGADTVVPKRPRPASKRTASLPNCVSRDKLVEFLEHTFSVPNVYGAYVTPEELCDIVEKYQDVTKAFLMHEFYHGAEMQIHLMTKTDVDKLFGDDPKPDSTDRGIRFGGLTEFASHADAVNYCKNSIGDEGCVAAWNVQGKYALNFMIASAFTETVDPSHPVTADELWAQICARRSSFRTTKSTKEPAPDRKPLVPGTKSKTSGCFVATACYGTSNCPELDDLRRFRDEVLLRSVLGRSFVAIYYTVSPTIAEWLKARPHAAAIVRRGILDRLVGQVRRISERMSNKRDAGDGK